MKDDRRFLVVRDQYLVCDGPLGLCRKMAKEGDRIINMSTKQEFKWWPELTEEGVPSVLLLQAPPTPEEQSTMLEEVQAVTEEMADYALGQALEDDDELGRE